MFEKLKKRQTPAEKAQAAKLAGLGSRILILPQTPSTLEKVDHAILEILRDSKWPLKQVEISAALDDRRDVPHSRTVVVERLKKLARAGLVSPHGKRGGYLAEH